MSVADSVELVGALDQLHELAGNDMPDAPRLLLGIEEPELVS